jgi:hypothetical protein
MSRSMTAAALGAHDAIAGKLLLGILPLGSGGALVMYILFGTPMWLPTVLFAATGIVAWAMALGRSSLEERNRLAALVRRGLLAGLLATGLYDAIRYGLASVASMSLDPFGALPRFGQALLGISANEPLALLAGVAFHVANGLGFAVALFLLVPAPGVIAGLAWAMLLELAMLALYPPWLGISPTSELLPISIAGHLAYGSALGVVGLRVGRH